MTPEELAKGIIDHPNLWGMYSIADEIVKMINNAKSREDDYIESLQNCLRKIYHWIDKDQQRLIEETLNCAPDRIDRPDWKTRLEQADNIIQKMGREGEIF